MILPHPASRAALFAAITLFTLTGAFLVQAQNPNNGTNSAVVAGNLNTINAGSTNAAIVAGTQNLIDGGNNNFIGAGRSNTVLGVGGLNNISVIVAGFGNTNAAGRSVIVGGRNNTIGTNSRGSTITGGEFNLIEAISPSIASGLLAATVGGGLSNIVGSNAVGAVVGGGQFNEASGPGATVPGGFANEASGTTSLAAGSQAVARNTGTFVWADSSTNTDFSSTGDNQFLIRAAGGVGINTTNPQGNALLVNGNLRVTGTIDGTFSNASINTVSSSNAFTIQSGGTTGFVVGVVTNDGANGSSRNLVAGHPSNSITAGKVGATIGGGGGIINSILFSNTVTWNFGTVSGGLGNTADAYATVGGGDENKATGSWSTVAGGANNEASGSHATIPGGSNNAALGNGSFAAGVRAKATNANSFVWGGSDVVDTFSTTNGQFVARAPGGVRFISTTNTTLGTTNNGVQLAAGGSSWSSLSDSNAKTDIQPLDHRQTLAKLAELPVTKWRYKHDSSREYIGPMAQDFHATFGLGSDDKHITTLDTDGVMLSAIKGLVEELREQEAVLVEQERQIQSLEQIVQSLREQLGHDTSL
jgi:hypothetical protein